MELTQLKTFTANGSKGEFTFSINEPSLDTLQKAMCLLHPFDGSAPNPYKAGELILRDAFHIGDQIVLTDPEYIMGASIMCINYIKFADVSIKKN